LIFMALFLFDTPSISDISDRVYARARLNGNLELSRRINIVRHSRRAEITMLHEDSGWRPRVPPLRPCDRGGHAATFPVTISKSYAVKSPSGASFDPVTARRSGSSGCPRDCASMYSSQRSDGVTCLRYHEPRLRSAQSVSRADSANSPLPREIRS
jgi:hypothetical protein